MTSFTWLHLTDLHWCTDQEAWLWPRMQQKFFSDLETLHHKCGPLDLVLFTGDLANRGLPEEFQGVDQLLDKLWKHLNKLGSNPLLLAVPGNHDLERPDPKTHHPELSMLKMWSDQLDVQKDFWKGPTSSYRQFVSGAFNNYVEWWNRQAAKPPGLISGMLPGDFAVTLRKGTSNLGIVGLNTAFLQLADGNYERRLAVSARQFHAACGNRSGPEWAQRHQACILMTHHPPSWLTRDSELELMIEIADPEQFAVHLFGHMHEPQFLVSSAGGGNPRRSYQGRSLFGLEFIEGPPKLQRLHGYSIARVELADGELSLTIWPREAQLVNNQWKLIPDYSYVLTDEAYTEISVVYAAGQRLLQSTEGWDGREARFHMTKEDKERL